MLEHVFIRAKCIKNGDLVVATCDKEIKSFAAVVSVVMTILLIEEP